MISDVEKKTENGVLKNSSTKGMDREKGRAMKTRKGREQKGRRRSEVKEAMEEENFRGSSTPSEAAQGSAWPDCATQAITVVTSS